MAGVMALVAPIVHAQPLTRTAATTLALPVVPPSFGYVTEAALNGMTFNQPLAVVSAPGETGRLFVVEKPGRILVVANPGSAAPTSSVFLDISAAVIDSGEEGLLALAFHPDFAANGYFYVWYTLNTTTSAGTGRHDRLSRFRVSSGNPNLADAGSELPLISQFDEASNHNGGDIQFGPDGYLYLSTGDEGGSGDGYANGQRIDRDFFSAMLRIDVDQLPGSLLPNAHPAVHAGTYRVPADNPYVGATSFSGLAVDAASVRTEFWAVGLRNPFRFSFDPSTGQLWLADVGQDAREEVDIITPGGNYGWPYREGFVTYRSNPPAGAVFLDPVHDYPRNVGTTVTGGIVYRGTQLSQIYGAYLFADYGSGGIWSLRTASSGPAEVDLLATNPGIVGFGVNPANGDILLANINEGRIRRLVYSTQTGAPFPASLGETGAFSSLATLTPAPGVVAYEPNVSFWSDYARKTRWFALPDSTSTFGYNDTDNWALPTGAVWVKHFDLELTRGDPSTARRIETRFLVKTSDGVYGLSYRWNDEQTDAALVPESGADLDLTVTEDGVARTQTWRFPSRAECLACHTPQAGYALSFNTRQLNRVHAFPGGAANQVTALGEAGYLSVTPPSPETLPALVPASDTAQPILARVKSYLDANCAQCHRPGGTALGTWDARFGTSLASAGIVDGPLIDNGGDAANRVIVPGDLAHSRLHHRISATSGATRMPPLGTNERDTLSEQLITTWVASLAPGKLPATITLSNLTGTYSGSPAIVGVDTLPSGLGYTITYDGAPDAPSHAGSYAVAVTIVDADYEGTAAGTLVISKAALTARADDVGRLQGAANPSLTISYTGFVTGDDASDLDVPPTASTSALADSPAGTYPITLTGGSDDDYTFTLVDGTLTVSTATQTISFGALADRVYGAAPLALSATASSGLPVSFAVASGPATISGNTVTLTGAGSVTIRATQGGNLAYAPAPAVERSFTVAKAALTARADNVGRLQGAANPSLTISYTGFVAGDDASDLDVPPTASTSALADSPAGTYPITLTGGSDDDYTFTLVDGTLTVSTATQTISFGALAERVYGDAPHALSATASSGLSVTFAVASGPATISGNTVTLTGAGSVTIRATQGGSAAYAPAPAVERSFTVAKAALTARADDVGRLQGAANPSLTISYTGFVAGDDASDLDVPPTASTSALADSPAGTYPITLTGGSDDNYTLTLVDGTLTVSTATQTISFGALANRVYGDASLALSATASSGLPVSFAVASGPATISGNTVTLTGAGSVTIRATQGGNLAYAPAPAVERSFTVAKAALTARADDVGRLQGAANPSLTISYTGFVAGDDASDLDVPPTASTSALAESPAGTYPITLTGGSDDNYTFTLVDGTLTVSTATQTISFGALANRVYGDASLALSATASSGLPVSFAVASGPATISGNTVTLTGAGSVTIRATQGGNLAYAPAPAVERSFTVARAALAARADDVGRLQGATNPSLTISYTGFVAGDDASDLDVPPTASTPALTDSPAGTYPITLTGGSDDNYTFTFVHGTLTISSTDVAPSITSQPTSQSRQAFSSASFFVSASGVPTPSYHWQRQHAGQDIWTELEDGGGIVGSRSATLTLASVVTSMNGDRFRCVATNGVDPSVTSDVAILSVSKATASIQLGELSRTYDGAAKVVTAQTAPPELAVLLTYDGSATAPIDAGTYAVEAVIDHPDYAGSASGVLTVSKAQLTVRGDDKSRAFAASNPPLTVSYEGFVAGDSPSVLTALPVASTLATEVSPPGTYAIDVSGGDAANYDLEHVPGTLTVVKAAASVSIAGTTQIYDGQPRPVTLTTTPAGLAVAVSYDGNAAPPTEPGSYGVTAVVEDPNYTGSAAATLLIEVAEHAGVYFGTLSAGGFWAMHVAPDRSGTFVAHAPGEARVVIGQVQVNLDGSFSAGSTASLDIRSRRLAGFDESLNLAGQIADGVATGQLPELNTSFVGTQDTPGGSLQALAGLYLGSGINAGVGSICIVVGPSGRALLVGASGTLVDGGMVVVDANGGIVGVLAGSTQVSMTIVGSGEFAGMIAPAGSTEPIEVRGLSAAVAPVNRIVNLSSRGQVRAGDEVMIVGFVIAGAGEKSVLLRAIGPTLGGSPFNVSDVLADPEIVLRHQGDGSLIATNDNWGEGPDLASLSEAFAKTGAFQVPPQSKDAALIATLPAGDYTAVIFGKGATAGNAIAEVYSIDESNGGARLVNVSARAFVGTGDAILIPGVTTNGNTTRRLLVRGVGPTLALAPFRVNGVLMDPELHVYVYGEPAPVASNDDWDANGSGEEIVSRALEVGAFALPRGSKDAALILTIPPNTGYTVVISGRDGGTGVAIAEVYEIP